MLDHFCSNRLASALSRLLNMLLVLFLASARPVKLHPVHPRTAFHQHRLFSHALLQRRLRDFSIQIVCWKYLQVNSVGHL
jgi:hypothetical protein